MRITTSLAFISALSLLAACAPNGEYYDSNGNYIVKPNSTTEAQRTHSPSPGGQSDSNYSERNHNRYADRSEQHSSGYERAGYYDYNGYYIDRNAGMNVPDDMFPPRGMCRVWFTNRTPAKQPGVESCNNIRSRVPAGAYVIYGG